MKRSYEEATDNSDSESHTAGTKREHVDDDSTGSYPLDKDDIEDDGARDVNVEAGQQHVFTHHKSKEACFIKSTLQQFILFQNRKSYCSERSKPGIISSAARNLKQIWFIAVNEWFLLFLLAL